jgi:hypothetical protein
MKKLPSDPPIETPIPISEITEFDDTNKTGATIITLGSTEAVLIKALY